MRPASGLHYHGYLYSAGTFSNIDIPGVERTLPHAINNLGGVALEWFGEDSVSAPPQWQFHQV